MSKSMPIARWILVASCVAALLHTNAALARFRVDTTAAINAVSNWMSGFISSQTTRFLTSLMDNASVVGAAIQGEMNKSAIAQKQVAEGIASYEAEERLRVGAARMTDDLRQPGTMCQTISAANSLNGAASRASARAFLASVETVGGRPVRRQNLDGSQSATLFQSIAYTSDSQRATLVRHDYVMANFCTDADQARGRCGLHATNPELSGADFNASFLFHGSDNSNTYTPKQETAVNTFIERIVSADPPEVLRDPRWDATPQGKAYTEMNRRYAAFMSMSAYSLHAIKASHMASQ